MLLDPLVGNVVADHREGDVVGEPITEGDVQRGVFVGGSPEPRVEHVGPEGLVDVVDGAVEEEFVRVVTEAEVEPVLWRLVGFVGIDLGGFRLVLVGVVDVEAPGGVRPVVEGKFDTLVDLLADVAVREDRGQGVLERREGQENGGQRPTRRRVRGAVVLRRVEVGFVFPLVAVNRHGQGDLVVEAADVADLVGGLLFFGQLGIAQRRGGEGVEADTRQGDGVDDGGIEVVFNQRRRPEGFVVGDPEVVVRRGRIEQAGARRHHRTDRVDVVEAGANEPLELVGEFDFVLQEDAVFVADIVRTGDRQVVVDQTGIAAVGDAVFAERTAIDQVDVVGLALELEEQRPAVEADGEQVVGRAVEQVGEEADLHGALAPGDLAVIEPRVGLDVERTDAGVHDAVRAGGAHREGNDLLASGHVVVEAKIGLGLFGAGVLEIGVGRGRAGDQAGRPIEGVLLVVTGREFEAGVFRSLGVGNAAEEGAFFARAELGGGAGEFPGRFGDHVDHAAHGVGAPHRAAGAAHDLDLGDFAEIDRQQVPHHEAEKVEVNRTAVEHDELVGGQRAGSAAAGDLDVAGGDLRHVEAGDRPENVAVVVGRGGGQLFGADDGHGDRDFLQPLLGAGSGDDDHLFDGVPLRLGFRGIFLREHGARNDGQKGHDRSQMTEKSHTSPSFAGSSQSCWADSFGKC